MEGLIPFVIIFIIVAILLLAAVYYGVPAPFKWIGYLVAILILLLIILGKFGGVLGI